MARCINQQSTMWIPWFIINVGGFYSKLFEWHIELYVKWKNESFWIELPLYDQVTEILTVRRIQDLSKYPKSIEIRGMQLNLKHQVYLWIESIEWGISLKILLLLRIVWTLTIFCHERMWLTLTNALQINRNFFKKSNKIGIIFEFFVCTLKQIGIVHHLIDYVLVSFNSFIQNVTPFILYLKMLNEMMRKLFPKLKITIFELSSGFLLNNYSVIYLEFDSIGTKNGKKFVRNILLKWFWPNCT